jgi:hypothetical protein
MRRRGCCLLFAGLVLLLGTMGWATPGTNDDDDDPVILVTAAESLQVLPTPIRPHYSPHHTAAARTASPLPPIESRATAPVDVATRGVLGWINRNNS